MTKNSSALSTIKYSLLIFISVISIFMYISFLHIFFLMQYDYISNNTTYYSFFLNITTSIFVFFIVLFKFQIFDFALFVLAAFFMLLFFAPFGIKGSDDFHITCLYLSHLCLFAALNLQGYILFKALRPVAIVFLSIVPTFISLNLLNIPLVLIHSHIQADGSNYCLLRQNRDNNLKPYSDKYKRINYIFEYMTWFLYTPLYYSGGSMNFQPQFHALLLISHKTIYSTPIRLMNWSYGSQRFEDVSLKSAVALHIGSKEYSLCPGID